MGLGTIASGDASTAMGYKQQQVELNLHQWDLYTTAFGIILQLWGIILQQVDLILPRWEEAQQQVDLILQLWGKTQQQVEPIYSNGTFYNSK